MYTPMTRALTLVSLLPALALAEPSPYDSSDGQITFRGTVVQSPCAALALMVDGRRLYAACGAEGVGIFELAEEGTPSFVGFANAGGLVTGFHRVGEQVWVEVTRAEARPLAELRASGGGGAVLAADRRAVRPAARKEGRVIASGGGLVHVDFGSDVGLARGDHVALFTRRDVELGPDARTTEEVLVAIGEVTAVTPKRAKVRLGLDERVPEGAFARATKKEITESRFNPPRMAGIWEAGFNLRPFLAIGAFGFGTVSDLWAGYRGDAPFHVLALVEPLGLGWADEGNVVAVAGNVFGAYDTRIFEIGLGLGWSAVNDDLESSSADARGPGEIDAGFEEVSSGLSIAQLARLGATDGVHVAVRNNFLLVDERFHYGGTVGQAQVPVSSRSWLLFRGGGGRAGYIFGELGLRWLARGKGDAGSLFLTVTAGGASLSGRETTTCGSGAEATRCTDDVDYGGPLVGFGMEWRR